MFHVCSPARARFPGCSQDTNITNACRKTAILMMNMGGPSTIPEVGPFLTRLFNDQDIMQLKRSPLSKALAWYIVKQRLSRIESQYEEIGGGSPIRKWTEIQGNECAKILDEISPETAPHKSYVAFRYAHPLSEETLVEMKKDGVERVIAFSQYPQFSCTTMGSSLNELWKQLKLLNMQDDFKWSIIDRWPVEDKFIEAVALNIEEALKKSSKPEEIIIIFSAHSLPMKTVNRGDTYAHEVNVTVGAVMDRLRQKGHKNIHYSCWQSQVGKLPWLGPQTGDVLKGLGKQGVKSVCVVPIAFTSDHIETLFEIDREYAEEAHEAGITEFVRSESMNGNPLFFQALADVVKKHLEEGKNHSHMYPQRCPNCFSPDRCRQILNPAFPDG